jgi:hypothetical protein
VDVDQVLFSKKLLPNIKLRHLIKAMGVDRVFLEEKHHAKEKTKSLFFQLDLLIDEVVNNLSLKYCIESYDILPLDLYPRLISEGCLSIDGLHPTVKLHKMMSVQILERVDQILSKQKGGARDR